VLQKLLIGNQKRPYGLDHLYSSRYTFFQERPFIVEAFNQDARRLGIQSYGVSEDLAYNWRYGVFNQRLIQDEGEYLSDHYQLEFAGRLANTLWYDEAADGRNYMHLAASGAVAQPDGLADGDPDPIGTGRAANEARFRTRPEARTESRWLDTGRIAGAEVYGLVGTEGVVNLGPLQLVAEYLNLWLDRNPGFGDDLHLHGGYMGLSYFLTGEHIPWDREQGILDRVEPFAPFYFAGDPRSRRLCGRGAWQVAVRWSFADLTDQDIAGGIGESVSAALAWYITAHSRMQINYIYGDIHDRAPVAGQTFGTYHAVGTRWLVDF
jgi:phosphate-selective porin OprO/OprP